MSSKTKFTAMKEEVRPALVPKLRFPGFSDPWAHEPLSKVLKEHKLKNTDGRDVFSVSMEYGIVNQIEHLGRSFAAADTSHYTIGRRFDVVYTKSPLKAFPFGIVKQCKFDGEVALSPLYGVFTPPNPHLGLLIEAYFESPNRSKDFLSPLCQKGAKNTLQITNTTFLSGRLPLPTQPAEQQKIAELLSSVDELMAAQALKVDALKTHKKGLMQQLFPREGETQPRLRFPEFQNAGEWAKDSMQGIFVFRQGLQVAIEHQFLENGDGRERFIRIIDVTQNNEPPRYITVPNNAYTLSVNDLFMIRYGTPGVVAIGYEGVIANNLFQLIFRIQEIHSPFFWYYFLQTKYEEISGLSGSSSMPAISFKTLNNIGVEYPSLPEQKRIASCLSSLDDLVTAETRKLDALKLHKKGLMQQLFPKGTDHLDG